MHAKDDGRVASAEGLSRRYAPPPRCSGPSGDMSLRCGSGAPMAGRALPAPWRRRSHGEDRVLGWSGSCSCSCRSYGVRNGEREARTNLPIFT